MRALPVAVLGCVLCGAAGAEEPLRPRWGELRLESPIPVDTLAWREALDLGGRDVDEAPLEPALLRGLRLLAARGYAFAEARPGSFDLDGNVVTGTIALEPGTQARVEGLVLEGAKVTRASTAERLAGVRPGDAYTGVEEEEARERLARSGLFSSVGEAEIVPGPEPGDVLLKIPVEEPAYTRFGGLLGVSGPESRVTGFLDLELTNIAGTAREASGRWEDRGDGLTRFALHYREPWIPFVPVGVAGDLEHDVFEGRYSYTKWEVVGDLGFGPWTFAFGRGGTRAVEVVEAAEEASEDRKVNERFFVAGIALDRRNAAANPTRGFRMSLRNRRGSKTLNAARDSLEIRVDRNRWEAAAEGYLGLGNRWLVAVGTRFDFLDTPEDSLPRWDLTAVGGATSVRGYREEQFLASSVWLVRNEVRWLQDRRGSSLYVLADVGFLNREGRRFADLFDRVLAGYGVGVRQANRLGILGVEYAVAKGESVLDGRIHLRIDAVF